MKQFEPPDIHHLTAAEGWIELGSPVEANAELENIAPELRAHPAVLDLRWHIYAHLKKWDECMFLADRVVVADPTLVSGWIHRSFALHELKRTQEAFDLLFPAVELFPKAELIRYNLACYCAQLGKIKEAREWLEKAFALGDAKEMKLRALDDPDLEPLWLTTGNG